MSARARRLILPLATLSAFACGSADDRQATFGNEETGVGTSVEAGAEQSSTSDDPTGVTGDGDGDGGAESPKFDLAAIPDGGRQLWSGRRRRLGVQLHLDRQLHAGHGLEDRHGQHASRRAATRSPTTRPRQPRGPRSTSTATWRSATGSRRSDQDRRAHRALRRQEQQRDDRHLGGAQRHPALPRRRVRAVDRRPPRRRATGPARSPGRAASSIPRPAPTPMPNPRLWVAYGSNPLEGLPARRRDRGRARQRPDRVVGLRATAGRSTPRATFGSPIALGTDALDRSTPRPWRSRPRPSRAARPTGWAWTRTVTRGLRHYTSGAGADFLYRFDPDPTIFNSAGGTRATTGDERRP